MRGHFPRTNPEEIRSPINDLNKYTGMRAIYSKIGEQKPEELKQEGVKCVSDPDLIMDEIWDIGGKAQTLDLAGDKRVGYMNIIGVHGTFNT